MPSEAAMAEGAVPEVSALAGTLTARPQVSSEEEALVLPVAGPVVVFGRLLPREGKLSPFPI